MKLPKELTTVTPLSKYFAMFLFISLPFIGFFMGMNYQSLLDLSSGQQIDISTRIIKPSPTPTPINLSSAYKIISFNKISPNNYFMIEEKALGDHQLINIKNSRNQLITEDLININSKEIGYNTKFKCQCGTSFAGWLDNSSFIIKIINGNNEEYQYIADAKTGKVDETTFRRIK